MTDYKNKYIKYKNKYLELKNRNQEGGLMGIFDIYKDTSQYENLNTINLMYLFDGLSTAYESFAKNEPYRYIGYQLNYYIKFGMTKDTKPNYVVSELEACRKVLINRTMNSLTTSTQDIQKIKNYLNKEKLWLKSFNYNKKNEYVYDYYQKEELTLYGRFIYDKLKKNKV
jgi:hypothetical protein